jgi:GT2 family glycosyltransferase
MRTSTCEGKRQVTDGDPRPQVKAGSVQISKQERTRVEGAAPSIEEIMSPGKLAARPLEFPRESDPLVSVVIIGWRNAPSLLASLDALSNASTSIPYEVILTLNEPTESLLSELDGGVTGIAATLRSDLNIGFGEANNRAVQRAKGPFVVFLNDDASVRDQWLDSSVALIEKNTEIGAVGSVLLNTNGSIQDAGCLIWRDGSVALLDHVLLNGHEPATRPALYCSAAAILVRKEVFEKVGGFDPGYFPAYYEDVDLCFKFRSEGFETWINTDSRVEHLRAGSTTRPFQRFCHERGYQRFLSRWSRSLEHVAVPPSQEDLTAYFEAIRTGFEDIPRLPKGEAFGVPALPDAPRFVSEEFIQQREIDLRTEFISSLEEWYLDFEEEVKVLSERQVELLGQAGELREQIDTRDNRIRELEGQKVDAERELELMRSRKVVRLADSLAKMVNRKPR